MRHRVLLIAAVMMAMMVPKAVCAYSFSAVAPTGQTLYYNISGISNVTVTYPSSNTNDLYYGFDRPSGALTIPSSVSYNGITYTVTAISDFAFDICNTLTSVIIPNSVSSIGNRAFGYCSGLTSVTIGNSVTIIGECAFCQCNHLTSVTIPNSVTIIGDMAFAACRDIASVTIGNSVTIIGDGAFQGCRGLTSVTIPNSVTGIGGSAFSGCSGLTSVTVPNSVTSIGGYAFSGCIDLTSVTIPNSVTGIEDYTFASCSGLTSVTIPNSVTCIGQYAFLNCSGLTSVTIPNLVTCIEDNAFNGCSGLTTVNYTGTIAQWCGIDFGNAYSNPTYCSHTLVIDGSPLTDIAIPEGVAEVKNYAFIGCSGLTGTLTIPNSVTGIGDRAFCNCSGLTSVNFNAINCVYMGQSESPVFQDCANLTTLNIGANVTRIPDNAFKSCSGLTGALVLPNSVTSIGSESFSGCTALDTVVVGNRVTVIPSKAFNDCNHITDLTLGGVVQSIAADAFSGCNAVLRLTSLSPVPPTAPNNPFADFNTSIPVYVPCNSVEAYQNATYWSFFSNIQCENASIEDVDDTDNLIYSRDGRIVVRGAEGMEMRVFDVVGREVVCPTRSGETPILPRGVYLVKIGNLSARKMVVIK